jgi:peptidoglycan/LPS O-acetylase OafA/YrhL
MSPETAESLSRVDVVDQPSRLAFKINNFDLIRLFAALQVLVFHALHRFDVAAPTLLKPFGWFPGVPIFFVISGYLISASFERNPGLWTYGRNRALRIFPGLWTCILLTVLACGLFGYRFFSLSGAAWFTAQLAGLIYTPAFLTDFGVGSYNGSLWTIPVELQFYVMLPILYWALSRFRIGTAGFAAVFLVFFGIALAISVLLPEIAGAHEGHAVKLLRYSFVPRFYLFLLGVLLQRLQVHGWAIIRGKGLYWLAGYAVFRLVVPQVGPVYMIDEVIVGLAIISLAYTVPTLAERLLRGNDVSYGVYLYHGLVINVMFELGYQAGGWLVGFALLLSVMVGYLSWIMVERPMIRNKARLAANTSRTHGHLPPTDAPTGDARVGQPG